MRSITKRVELLEEEAGRFAAGKPCHAILKAGETPYRDALADYIAANPTRPVEPDHDVFWIELVSPESKLSENRGDGPELAEVLAELGP